MTPPVVTFNFGAVGAVDVKLDNEWLERQIEEVIRDKLAYQVRDQAGAQISVWIREAVEAKKQEIMAKLIPEIERKLQNAIQRY